MCCENNCQLINLQYISVVTLVSLLVYFMWRQYIMRLAVMNPKQKLVLSYDCDR